MTALDANSAHPAEICAPTELDHPYIVCNTCAHTWEAAIEEPARCENCGEPSLWAFPTLDAAEQHSQDILDRA